MNVKQWIEMTKGNKYDVDGCYGPQCWDYFAYFCKYFKLTNMNCHCSLTQYAGDIWRLRNVNNASLYFDFITNVNDIKDGDWCFWSKHVAMYYDGMEYGQNQNYKPQVTAIPFIKSGFIGAFRFKEWKKQKAGTAEKYDKKYSRAYICRYNLNLRTGGNTDYPIIITMLEGQTFRCYGYYHVEKNGKVWLYGVYYNQGKKYTGFACADYLK